MLTDWFAANPWALAFIAPALGGFLNWIVWFPESDDWAKFKLDHPRWASAVQIMRAVFPHLRKVPQLAAYLKDVSK